MPIRIKIKGLPKLVKELTQREKRIWKVTMAVVDKYVTLMVADARQNAPEDMGILKNSIRKEKKDEFHISFTVGAVYAAMQEFGTGVYMDIPKELEQEALVWKGYKSGNFDEFVAELKEWCERKGIDPEAAYPIARKILRYGSEPHPFFYPAYLKYKDQMLAEINRELQELFYF